MNITTIVKKFISIPKMLLILVLVFAFIGGAAMAFQPGVSSTAQGLGMTVWVGTFLITIGWIASAITSKYVANYAQFREGDTGFLVRFFVFAGLFLLVLILMSVALAIH